MNFAKHRREELEKAFAEGSVVPLNEAAEQQMGKLKPMTLVRFDYESLEPYLIWQIRQVFGDDVWVFVGEITNMPEHGVFLNHRTGQIVSGYHIDNFVEIGE